MKYKMIGIIGQSGVGKDSIANAVYENNKNLIAPVVSYTTRSPRDKEVNGKDYYFISPDEMISKILDQSMLEASEFNGWVYGTSKDSLSLTKVNLAVLNPDGVESIMMHKDIDLVIFLIEAEDKRRIIRQLNREENPDIFEIFRRYKADIEDFDGLNFHYNVLNNNTAGDFEQAIKVVSAAAARLQAKED